MTIFGEQTIAELTDLIKAKDYAFNQISDAAAAFDATWAATDSAAHDDWMNDWTALRGRYAGARTKAMAAIDLEKITPGPASLKPAQPLWDGVMAALSKDPTNPGFSKGDLLDVSTRLAAAQGKPISMPDTPQPTATDADLQGYRAADSLLKDIPGSPGVGPSHTSPWVWGGVLFGLLASLVGVNALVKKHL